SPASDCGHRIRGSSSTSRSATTRTPSSTGSARRSPPSPRCAARSAGPGGTCSCGSRPSSTPATVIAPRSPSSARSRIPMPDAQPRDEDLVRGYLSGDYGAFAALVERHERRVYNLALRMTGREEDARDATQDAFLTALRKLSSFRGEAAFTTWMHRVTINACYDLLRKRARQPLLDLGDDEHPRPEPTPAPDHADATELSIDVQRALLEVPEDFR